MQITVILKIDNKKKEMKNKLSPGGDAARTQRIHRKLNLCSCKIKKNSEITKINILRLYFQANVFQTPVKVFKAASQLEKRECMKTL